MKQNDSVKYYSSLSDDERGLVQIVVLLLFATKKTPIIEYAVKCGLLKSLKKAERFALLRNLILEGILLEDSDGVSADYSIRRHIQRTEFKKNTSNIHHYFAVIKDEQKKLYESFSFGVNYEKRKFYECSFTYAFYSTNEKLLTQTLNNYKKHLYEENIPFELFLDEFRYGFTADIMEYVPTKYQYPVLDKIVSDSELLESKISKVEFINYCQNLKTLKTDDLVSSVYADLADDYFETGNLEELAELIKLNVLVPDFHQASLDFLRGNHDKAYKEFSSEIKAVLGKSKRKYVPPKIYGAYFCLLLIARGDLDDKTLTSAVAAGLKANPDFYAIIRAYLAFVQGDLAMQKKYRGKAHFYALYGYERPIATALLHAMDKNALAKDDMAIEDLLETINDAFMIENKLLVMQCYYAIKFAGKIRKIPKKIKTYAENHCSDLFDFTTLLKSDQDWERSLKILKNIAQSTKNVVTTKGTQAERLVWFVNTDSSSLTFTPREQKLGKNGKWSKGRPIALKRIMRDELDCMTPLDQQIGAAISEERFSTYGYYYETAFILDMEKAMPHFLKHPHLFLEDSPGTPFELVEEELQLVIKRKGNAYELSLSHDFDDVDEGQGYQTIRETSSRYKMVKITQAHMQMAQAFNADKKLVIPKTAEKELNELVSGLSAILTVHSDLKTDTTSSNVPSVKASAVCHVHLLPVGEGTRIELFVRPFKSEGPYFKPGYGGETILAEIKGKTKCATRQLAQEQKNADNVIQACPSLAIRGKHDDIFEFYSLEETLEVLLELQDLKKNVIIEWPEGETYKIVNKFSLTDFSITASKSADWFDIDGQLTVDEKRVIDLQQLLNMPVNAKFIELNSGEFVALTESLKRKLEELNSYTFSAKNKTRIHPLNADAADALLSDVPGFKPGRGWKAQLKKAEDAKCFVPVFPSTFQAELRPYQLDGFNWLSRLANWGVGACLADDMGLGKTVQALAIILERAKKGPALVVAPASVCRNWQMEAARFAPSLNVHVFGSGNRNECLEQLKPFDLIICSYGLLMHEEKNLTKINWTSIVLDEAQSIKNYKAKRTKAAYNLKSEFKLITTGTPVENHLTELWTLFSFLNPGFLGTLPEFKSKFAAPIEQNNDIHAKKSLKKIIRPFILRRLKTEVLEELPEKTEISLTIELSDDERAFYEAIRRDSVANIETMKEEKGGAFHLQILTELTKLRRACCHPSLVSKNIEIESSKISQFLELVVELKENRHKALVFSQFVDHLSILRQVCDANKITYQYLDGSTPVKERQNLVNNFQNGESDIFLISLKAGGTGLNLTAADYVIHMDPWWNPAVEDQASDRAHRIGQQRPVTVYRFVAQNTVEEKIVALHKTKRALADSLLDGTDVTGKMSTTELLELMR